MDRSSGHTPARSDLVEFWTLSVRFRFTHMRSNRLTFVLISALTRFTYSRCQVLLAATLPTACDTLMLRLSYV
jgi:hypothetical protein